MPAILSQASGYPPRKWRFILEPFIPSTNHLWVEMTEAYELSMEARQLQASATVKDTITKSNIRLLSPEALEELEKKASVPRRMGLESENDIAYTFLHGDRYKIGYESVVKCRM